MSRSRTIFTVAVIATLIPMLLAGCGSNKDATALADTKGPSQLLRNEISSRVPAADVQKLGDTTDASISCGDNGIMRSWKSDQMIFIDPDAAYKMKSVLTDLIGVLKVEGWGSTLSDPSSNIHEAKLTSSKTTSTIILTATGASDAKGNGATMEIAVTGPCVKTAGPDSDEVKHLEAKD